MLHVGLEKRRTMTEDGTPPIVNRYAGQRLYDPAAGAYLTLDDLAQRVTDDALVVTEAGDDHAASPQTDHCRA
jgi:polyhydroxyalkanoate synthesis regulator protein